MQKPRTLAAVLVTAMALSHCSNDKLASSVGALGMALCDRGAACGCSAVGAGEVIDFGSPAPGSDARRVLTLKNDNQPRRLIIQKISVDDPSGAFSVVAVQRRSSDANNATVQPWNLNNGSLVLSGTEEGTAILAFAPSAAGQVSATLTVESNSADEPQRTVTLRGGGGQSTVCVPSGACGDGSTIDFGTHDDSEIALDSSTGLPVALDTENITITNPGKSDLFVTVQLTDDGIPSTGPNDLVGDNGVFFLGKIGCTVIPPNGSLTVPVEYRPSTAGEHHGEVTIGGTDTPVHIELLGKVVGAHLCFRTEDDQPNDSILQFGDAPSYTTPQNVPETRSLWVGNCGYQRDLTISNATATPQSSPDFATTALPWTQTAPVAPGDEIEIPVVFTPSTPPGSTASGGIQFTSNDALRPSAVALLHAGVGQPERCILVASPSTVDFGWVATDEANQGVTCGPIGPCIGQQMVSRSETLQLTNAGQLPCTNITFSSIVADSASTGMFTIQSNPNPAGFTLAPGASSQPVGLLFAQQASDTATDHYAKLPYQSPDMQVSPINIILKARAGGTPDCKLTFQPVSAAGLFCPNETLAFGNVNIGQQRTVNLEVSNTGSDTCTITSIQTSSGTSSVFSFTPPATSPLVLNVNDSATIPVTFAPVPPDGSSGLGDLPFGCGFNLPGSSGSASLVFNYYSGTASGTPKTKELELSGKGTQPKIDVIPGNIDFGEVTVGCCSAPRRIAIYNGGDGTLDIQSADVQTSSDPGFSITQPGSMSIAPGDNTDFTAKFCADSVGAHSGVIEIQSNDGNNEYYTVAATADGTTDNQGDDTYQQPLRPQVDVLWVVDDSGSMSDKQQELADNFDTFINQAVTLNTDYHLGVISTDAQSDWAGKLYSCQDPPRFITSDQPTADQRSQFRCNVKTSDYNRPHSDAKESGLQAARLALDYPNLTGYNAGFYRDAAKLYIIIVTDEIDQSDGSAQQYVDYFQNLKGIGNPDLLNISAITGPPPDGCATADSNPVDRDAVQMVGGQLLSICTADWTTLLNNLGLDVFNARAQFPLSRPGTASTIAVQVCDDDGSGNSTNCQTVPQDATNGWTFDGNLNSITFHGSSVPGPAQHIEITYDAVCY